MVDVFVEISKFIARGKNLTHGRRATVLACFGVIATPPSVPCESFLETRKVFLVFCP